MEEYLSYLLHLDAMTIYFLVLFVLVICGLGLPIPEDITLFVAAMACYYKITDVWTMVAVSYIGIMGGDSVIFYLGHHYGRRLQNVWPFRLFLTPETMSTMRSFLEKRGNKLLFMARFMPGLRAPIFFFAGTVHVPYRVFLFYDGVAALISVPIIIWAVYNFGDHVDWIVQVVRRTEHGILALIVSIIVLFGLKHWWKRRK